MSTCLIAGVTDNLGLAASEKSLVMGMPRDA
ncbi:hypothetical protein Rcae01_05542 [Novipirellula caenicola]|uniref:Uncharacterized protein n=1 Tax=Novipirellula caenicola TaxID=1536901 RepID=A0ABP9VZ95_9BACT